MRRAIVVGVVLAFGCLASQAGEASKAKVKKLAEELSEHTIKGNYAKVIDLTYDGIIKEMGGREKAIKATEAMMKLLADRGGRIKSYKVEDPGEFVTGGGNTFVVVPATMELTIPGGRVVTKTYLLGISPDAGKSWKFVDGGAMGNKELREKLLPKLPAKLKLPPAAKPEVIKDN